MYPIISNPTVASDLAHQIVQERIQAASQRRAAHDARLAYREQHPTTLHRILRRSSSVGTALATAVSATITGRSRAGSSSTEQPHGTSAAVSAASRL